MYGIDIIMSSIDPMNQRIEAYKETVSKGVGEESTKPNLSQNQSCIIFSVVRDNILFDV